MLQPSPCSLRRNLRCQRQGCGQCSVRELGRLYIGDLVGVSASEKKQVLDELDSSQAVGHTNEKLASFYGRAVQIGDLKGSPDVQVINIRANQSGMTEAALFAHVFTQPVQKMEVNDGYLLDEERIISRLGAYIDLAAQHG